LHSICTFAPAFLKTSHRKLPLGSNLEFEGITIASNLEFAIASTKISKIALFIVILLMKNPLFKK